MDVYEALLARYTAIETREILGAIGIVINDQGSIVYHKAGGLQSLSEDAQALDKDAVFELGSAGKLFIHIAALQCVDRGLIGLDEPASRYLPDLANLQVVTRAQGTNAEAASTLVLRKPTSDITLRHLLTHTSGMADPSDSLLAEWEGQSSISSTKPSAPVNSMIYPLLFDPGEGWSYGSSISWTAKLVTELTGQKLPDYAQANIFDPVGMTSSTFLPLDESSSRPDLRDRRLQMIVRQRDSDTSKTQLLYARRAPPMAPATTAGDFGKLVSSLILQNPAVRILSAKSIDLLFSGQLSGKALQDLRADTETYAAPTGIAVDAKDPKVNFTVAGGLLVEESCKLSGLPSQTLTWNGMPNVIWSVNRERKKAAIFATQLLPVDDPVAVELAMAFFKGAWEDALR